MTPWARDTRARRFRISRFRRAHVTDQIRNDSLARQLGLAAAAAVAVVAGSRRLRELHFRMWSTMALPTADMVVSVTSRRSCRLVLDRGRPRGASVVYRLRAVLTARTCVNGGAEAEPRTNHRDGAAANDRQLAADQNGRITGSHVLDTSSVAPTGFSCPTGQTLAALSATFTNNTITDTTNGVTATDDDISVTF
jgi:hypothetical protein